jgi:hypothetical protein
MNGRHRDLERRLDDPFLIDFYTEAISCTVCERFNVRVRGRMQSRGSDHVFIYTLLLGLLRALAAAITASRREAEPARAREQARHPESLTAILEPHAEEYLAWLADHHWPNDEYLEERHWRIEFELTPEAGPNARADGPRTAASSECPQCRRPGEDVWPCRTCARLLHSACGHGMRRRPVTRPYRTRDMSSETVIAEWICTDCSSVVALDVHPGEEHDHGPHAQGEPDRGPGHDTGPGHDPAHEHGAGHGPDREHGTDTGRVQDADPGQPDTDG